MKQVLLRSFILLCISATFNQAAGIPRDVLNLGEVTFRHVSQDTEIADTRISAIVQDENGYIWAATFKGLFRFDGLSFKAFKASRDSKTLRSNLLTSLHYDGRGNLWIGTRYGVDVFNIEQEKVIANIPNENGSDVEVRQVVGGADNSVWVVKRKSIVQLDIDSYQVSQRIHLQDFISTSTIRFVSTFLPAESDARTHVIVTPKSLFKWDGEQLSLLYQINQDDKVRFTSSATSTDQHIIIGTTNGLMFFDNKGSFVEHKKNYVRKNDEDGDIGTITNIKRHDDVFYVVSDKYVFMYDEKFNFLNYFSFKSDSVINQETVFVRDINVDREGGLWLGLNVGGLRYLSGQHAIFRKLNLGNKVEETGFVWALAVGADDSVWLNSGTQNIYRIARKSGDITHYSVDDVLNALSGPEGARLSHHFSYGKEGSIIAPLNKGFLIYDFNTESFRLHAIDVGERDFIKSVVEWKKNQFFIATNQKGVLVYYADEEKLQSLTEYLDSENLDTLTFVYELYIDKFNNLWVAERNALYKINLPNKKFEKFLHSEERHAVASHFISQFLETKKGEVWLATINGLSKYNPTTNSFANYYVENGLSDNAIMALADDDDGRLWLSTEYGLTLFDTTEGKTKKFYKNHGLQGNDYYSKSIAKDRYGYIYISGPHGVSVFHPRYIGNDSTPPTPFISGVIIIGSKQKNRVMKPDSLTLDPEESDVAINFHAFNFSNPSGVYYRYKMGGFEETWWETQAPLGIAQYSNLPPGKYQFIVQSSLDQLQWSDHDASLNIHVLTPWHQTHWAYSLYVFCAISLVAIVFRLIVGRAQEKLKTAAAIKESEERLSLSLEASGNEMWDWDVTTGEVNRSVKADLKCFAEIRALDIDKRRDIITESDYERANSALEKHLAGKSVIYEASFCVHVKDKAIWVYDTGKIVERKDNGDVKRMSGLIKDISIHKEREERIKLLAKVFENSTDGVWISDKYGCVIVVNKAYQKITGISEEDIIGHKMSITRRKDEDGAFSEKLRQVVRNKGFWRGELWDVRDDGTEYLIEVVIEGIRDEFDNITHYIGSFSDISEKYFAQQELLKLANYDPLSGLPNRTLLFELLERACVSGGRRNETHAFIYIDLDNFKYINDSLGHSVGDKVIIEVAESVRAVLRKEDTIARIGGDEFGILLDSIQGIDDVDKVANKLIQACSRVFSFAGKDISISASLGVSIFPNDTRDANELVRNAEIAMYHTKERGKNAYQFYASSMNERVQINLEQESMLRSAIRDNRFLLHFQPRVSVTSNLVRGAEALVRLIDKEGKIVFPDKFIPVAEQTGLIEDVDDIVLFKVCQQIRDWKDRNIHIGRVSLNLSGKAFGKGDEMITYIDRVVKDTGIDYHDLEVEITEGMLLNNIDLAIYMMAQLDKRNVLLAMDDFGTGYSSLSYLMNFSVHTLKIDRSFIFDMVESEKKRSIVRSIVNLAHNLNLKVVAEGVEDIEQLKLIREYGCEEYQGYYFSRPITSKDFETKILTKHAIEKI